MGLVGNLSDPAPVLPTVVSSADGALRVKADSVWGGAELVVDFSTKQTVNLVNDPSFETGPGTWGGPAAVTGDATHVHSGAQAVKIDQTNGQAYKTVATGLPGSTTYTLITHVWIPSTETGNPAIRLGSTGVNAYTGAAITGRDQWVECREVFTTDADGGALAVYPAYLADGAYWADSFALIEGEYDGPWFFGDTPDTVTDSYEWDGPAHASTSTHTAYPTTPHSIRIHRRTPDGQVVAVRGADPNLSPGGISPGYDHEAPLGVVCTWWAEALDRTGTVLWVSDEVTLTIPWGSGHGAWVKSLSQPDRSLQVRVDEWEEQGRDARTSTYDIHGRASRAATLRTPARLTATLGIQARDRAEYDAIAALLDSGVILLDSQDSHGIGGPRYLVRTGDLAAQRPGNTLEWKYRRFVATVEIIDRPPTPGSPMRTPAVSWETLPYSTYTEIGAANPTWLDLIDG